MSSSVWYRRLSRTQWLILVVAWLGWVFDIMDTALFNFAKVPMMTEMLGATRYKLEGPRYEGLVQTCFLVGWSIGGLVFGILADRWGRTRTLIITILLYCGLTGLTAFCRSPEQVMVARFLTALGIGGEWAAGAALVAESMPDDLRPIASSLLQCAAAVGPVMAALLNIGLAHSSWRNLFLVGILPAFICIFIRMKVVEPERSTQQEKKKSESTIHEIFRDPLLRRNALVAMAIGVVGVTGAGIAPFWLPNLVKEVSVGLPEALIRTRTSNATMVMHIGTLLGVFAFPVIAERLGRRRAFALFFGATPIVTTLALFGGASYERLLIFMPMTTFFAIGVSAGFVLYFPELFPTRVRATGAGLAYNVGRIFSAPIPWLTGILMGMFSGSIVTGVLMSSGIYLVGLLSLYFAPETKGRPLPRA